MKNKKLKTLKDLIEQTHKDLHSWEDCSSDGNCPKPNPRGAVDFFNDKLKAEAVKWVRWSERREVVNSNKKEFFMATAHNTTKSWIKHFFNLTEEDLKNEKNK